MAPPPGRTPERRRIWVVPGGAAAARAGPGAARLPVVERSDPGVRAGQHLQARQLKVKSGDTVTFTNDGAVAHTVTATEGADFDSGTLAPGKTFSFVASGHGKLTYVCTIHPGMQGHSRSTDRRAGPECISSQSRPTAPSV